MGDDQRGARQKRLMGFDDYLKRRPDQAATVHSMVARVRIDRLLREGSCAFCATRSIIWGYELDWELAPVDRLQWATCGTCEELLDRCDDASLTSRVVDPDTSSQLREVDAAKRVADFRRALYDRFPLV